MDKPTIASPSDGGWHPWYELHVDPDNADNMIICGSKWSAKSNNPYGFIYYSADKGKTWIQALEDRSSSWVTEHSCAYGVHGVAYFVSDAAKVLDGNAQLDLGTTRIYTSGDSGRTWKVGITTGWTDASTSVVDTMPGPNQNRLYLFFNNLSDFYRSSGEIAAAAIENEGNDNGSRVGMISYNNGETGVTGPVSGSEMAKEKNHGSYPVPAILLKDGSILTFYTATHRSGKDRVTVTAEAVRVGADRSTFETPVKLFDSGANSDVTDDRQCGYVLNDSAGAYDAIHDKLYFVYPAVRDKRCHLFVTTSADKGRSWAKPLQIVSPDEAYKTKYFSPTIAVNREGILGVMWQRDRNSGCWMFAISEDDGGSLSRAERLGTCGFEPRNLNVSSVGTSIIQASSVVKPSKSDTARIYLRNSRNIIWRDEGIVTLPDGTFHLVWHDSVNSNGELRSVAVNVTSSDRLIASATRGLLNVTTGVAVLYGGTQCYNSKSGTLSFDILIKNTSAKPMNKPFKIVISHLDENYEFADIMNADNGLSGAGAVWDVSSSVPNGFLSPGAASRPYTLRFHYPLSEDADPSSADILALNLKVFAAGHSKEVD